MVKHNDMDVPNPHHSNDGGLLCYLNLSLIYSSDLQLLCYFNLSLIYSSDLQLRLYKSTIAIAHFTIEHSDILLSKKDLPIRLVNGVPVVSFNCTMIGRAFASYSRGPQFKSSHGKNLYWTFTVNCIEKTKIKKKRPGSALYTDVYTELKERFKRLANGVTCCFF